MKPTITGLVLTGNSQRLLDKCLGSMAFCDEILVVDCFSSDATLDIAKRHGARVVSNAWPGYAAQHAFAQANVLSRGLIAEHDGELWVASPLKKQHFRLKDGVCLENADFSVRAYPVQIEGDQVAVGL